MRSGYAFLVAYLPGNFVVFNPPTSLLCSLSVCSFTSSLLSLFDFHYWLMRHKRPQLVQLLKLSWLLLLGSSVTFSISHSHSTPRCRPLNHLFDKQFDLFYKNNLLFDRPLSKNTTQASLTRLNYFLWKENKTVGQIESTFDSAIPCE